MKRKIVPASVRLARLARLREYGAPKWVIKSEQVALALGRKGLLHNGIGKDGSKEQVRLYDKFVRPYMGNEE